MWNVVEKFSWLAPNGLRIAIHCPAPEGSVKVSNGFRIVRNGKVMFPSCLPFKTREEAEKRMIDLAFGE